MTALPQLVFAAIILTQVVQISSVSLNRTGMQKVAPYKYRAGKPERPKHTFITPRGEDGNFEFYFKLVDALSKFF